MTIHQTLFPSFGVGCAYVVVLLWLCHKSWQIAVKIIPLHYMSTGYQIYDKAGSYYLTFQVVDWVDIFSRKVYRDIILDSFAYCRKYKGLQLWAYVIMSNHVHTILSAENGNLPDIIRDFKRHTAAKILKEIKESNESRKDWMLKRFEFAAKSHKRNSEFQFWTHEMSNFRL
ncbi:MAG: transposase [Saprospiraceae bacterium]